MMSIEIAAKFKIYHRENPHVYEAFKKFAFEAIAAGFTRYGSKSIFERVRWHYQIEKAVNDKFKMNDNYTAYYARLFIEDFPDHFDFFELRALSEERKIKDDQPL